MASLITESIYGLRLEEISRLLKSNDLSSNSALLVYQSLYKNIHKQDISARTWKILKNNFSFNLPTIVKTESSKDGTYKFLMQLDDGHKIETVLIPFHKKYTVCLSSQVGCAMKCSFCYTGTQGFTRHLKAGEIVGQYLVVQTYLFEKLSSNAISPNIVFMGQGEPLHNFEEIKKTIHVLLEPKGLALGPRQITLSTAGYLPGLQRFNELPQVNLALSLHSAFNHKRKNLIPISEQFPLEDILIALDAVKLMKRQFITYEYLLIDDINNSTEDADELEKILKNKKAIINLIAFNPFPGSSFKRPDPDKVENFKQLLVQRKLRTMVRTTKGNDILAACGQLTS